VFNCSSRVRQAALVVDRLRQFGAEQENLCGFGSMRRSARHSAWLVLMSYSARCASLRTHRTPQHRHDADERRGRPRGRIARPLQDRIDEIAARRPQQPAELRTDHGTGGILPESQACDGNDDEKHGRQRCGRLEGNGSSRLKASLARKPDTAVFKTRPKNPICLPSPPSSAPPND